MEIPMYPVFALAFATLACFGFYFQLSQENEDQISFAAHQSKSLLMAFAFAASCQYFWKLSNTYFLWCGLAGWMIGSLIGNLISQRSQVRSVYVSRNQDSETHQTQRAS